MMYGVSVVFLMTSAFSRLSWSDGSPSAFHCATATERLSVLAATAVETHTRPKGGGVVITCSRSDSSDMNSMNLNSSTPTI